MVHTKCVCVCVCVVVRDFSRAENSEIPIYNDSWTMDIICVHWAYDLLSRFRTIDGLHA